MDGPPKILQTSVVHRNFEVPCREFAPGVLRCVQTAQKYVSATFKRLSGPSSETPDKSPDTPTMGKRYLGVQIAQDGYVAEQPDRRVRPKPSPDQGFLSGEPGKAPVGDRPTIPAGVKVIDAPSPLPFHFWAAYLRK